MTQPHFDPFVRFTSSFRLSGEVNLSECPLCASEQIAELWRLPQNRLSKIARLDAPGSPVHGTYVSDLPTLETPQTIYRFDICGQCETIFLNPKSDDHAIYARDASKVQAFRAEGPEAYRAAASAFLRMIPDDARRIVDAACGAGQVLHLLHEMRPDLELIGLELSAPSVDFIRDELGIPAHAVDLDRDDLRPHVAPGTADFVLFEEAFEHVRSPIITMRKLVEMLRPGGRMHFTAQYWGDNPLQIRVGEPLYINQRGFDYVVETLGLRVIELTKDIKMRATVLKPA